MDPAQKISLIGQLNYLDIIEHFQMKNAELDIDMIDDDDYKNDEEFFHLVAGSINRLGLWSVEIEAGIEKLIEDGPQKKDLVDAFN